MITTKSSWELGPDLGKVIDFVGNRCVSSTSGTRADWVQPLARELFDDSWA
jgi:hypothetical protein